MLSDIIQNRYAVTAVILFGIGFTNLMLQQNLLRKVIGFNIMDSAGLSGLYRGRRGAHRGGSRL